MTNPRHNPTHARRRGFTLTELLVVIVVIVLLFTVAVPNIKELLSSGQAEVARNAFSVAVASARTWAGVSPSMDSGKSFQGSAILITNANEMRILYNTDKDEKNKLIVNGSNAPLGSGLHAYRDVPETGYVYIPRNMGVVGIRRGIVSGAGATYLVSPPFCMRFSTDGNLIANQVVPIIYDGKDYNNQYTSTDRSGATSFDPDQFDPISSKWVTSNFNTTADKYLVATFESYENVVGVIVYDKQDFWAAGYSLVNVDGSADGSDDGGKGKILTTDAAYTWLKQNGTVLFFNFHSGGSIKP
ncbi:MAG: prepilin-type N-terminal cleavage/methylation domain-containing protein [Phycisphaera sp.]|nr:prepilin-type N-terminal cleavage/methylation domain-containing protein [Phycisphaera sp.]